MKSLLHLFFCILFSNFLAAQHFQINEVNYKAYTLPIVSNDIVPEIADKINATIQEKLNTPFQREGYSALSSKTINDFTYSYFVGANNYAILSLGISFEYLAAREYTDTLYLNFNARTGDLLKLQELIEPISYYRLQDDVKDYYDKKIIDFIKNETLLDYQSIAEAARRLLKHNKVCDLSEFFITSNGFYIYRGYYEYGPNEAAEINWTYFLDKTVFLSVNAPYKLTSYGNYVLNTLH